MHMAFLPLADSYGISPSGGSFNDFWGDGGADTLRSLLTNGSDPDIKNRAGDSPLMIALRQKRGILGVRMLLTHGADPNTVDAQGTPALVQSVLGHTRFSAGGTDPIPVIEMLIKAGANPNASTPDGATTLHHALDTPDDGSILQTLIDLDANPNAQDRQGETPLHRLVRKPSFASGLLATLIDGGADPCIQNHHGNTPREVARNVAYEDHLPECKQTPGNTSQHLHAEFECRVTPEDPGCPSECMDIILPEMEALWKANHHLNTIFEACRHLISDMTGDKAHDCCQAREGIRRARQSIRVMNEETKIIQKVCPGYEGGRQHDIRNAEELINMYRQDEATSCR